MLTALITYYFTRKTRGKFSGIVEQKISGEVERIGQFNGGYRHQNSFVIHLKDHEMPYYAHPNFGQSGYLPDRFIEMSKRLALTQPGDQIHIGICTKSNSNGKAEHIILEFSNSKLNI